MDDTALKSIWPNLQTSLAMSGSHGDDRHVLTGFPTGIAAVAYEASHGGKHVAW